MQYISVRPEAAVKRAAFLALALLVLQPAWGHSLFNSAEQTVGGYRMQVATLPEFPQVGEPSQILFRLTDESLGEVSRFSMSIRIFYNGEQVQALRPQSIDGGHWQMQYTFERGGNHIFRVDAQPPDGRTLQYTFNMSTQSPFGYIFFIAITAGAGIFGIVMSYVYMPKIRAWLSAFARPGGRRRGR